MPLTIISIVYLHSIQDAPLKGLLMHKRQCCNSCMDIYIQQKSKQHALLIVWGNLKHKKQI
uniref:Uncharacterized protein n=1 Tax=Rhizophora mucronata TaxID=61149 RepID=A0A2P2QCD6_RHIMU